MDTFTIRRESEADIPAIRDLTSRAFVGKPYSNQQESSIIESLRDADALTFSFMAVKGSSLVGHIAASPVTISNGAVNWLAIGPISVDPQRQGEGIGSQLMRRVLKELREINAGGAVAVGDPTFYQRFGLEHVADLVLPGVDKQYFLAMPLADSAMPSGEVSYHRAFCS
ncbi:GNAT family N-acetyltransferase [Corynebacterium alimapuense]|uniref:GNAT family N-acetyltransferase n=1 Tax=Corynebacterium alimapuense TaxID=1576874 RepID=A0A3M8K4N5_9CORY|nr:N-acetyltransferase [Corynebacterium alimapuense]RNE48183.1 GNAT family N-acetyltransferase [Corynebacterium alimapuense]